MGSREVLRFVSLGSGSSGNSSLISYGKTLLMLDAGIPYRQTLAQMQELGVTPEMISGILITHDHIDHTRSLSHLALKHFIPVYCAAPVARSLIYHKYARAELNAYLRVLERQTSPLAFGELEVEYFQVPHDATHNVGYTITSPGGVFSLITDIGHPTRDILNAIKRSNFLVVESNYDTEMLLNGRYPLYLKERIRGGLGHISNDQLGTMLQNGYHDGLKFIALSHLSKDNNRPEIALSSLRRHLEEIDLNEDCGLETTVLPRYGNSRIFELALEPALQEVF